MGHYQLSFIFTAISGLICFAFPLVLMLICRKKTGTGLISALVGAVTFVLFAMVLEQLCHKEMMTVPAIVLNPWLYVLYGGFAAGIFEETGRLFAFSLLLKKRRDKAASVMYGIGHGGIEAILIAGINAVASGVALLLLILRGEAGIYEVYGGLAGEVISIFQATPPVMYLVSGAERIVAIVLHISLSVLVFKAVRQRKLQYWLLAILLHAVVDFLAAMYQVGMISNIWLLEGVLLLMTAGIAVLAWKLYRLMPTTVAIPQVLPAVEEAEEAVCDEAPADIAAKGQAEGEAFDDALEKAAAVWNGSGKENGE